jgi:Flp pilus assembly protein TadD
MRGDILAYGEAIRLDPQYAEAWYNKGAALEALGRDTDASTAFARAKGMGYVV